MLLAGVYALDGPEWEHVSSSAKDMVRRMMELDPSKRWDAEELLGHVWFQVRETGWETLYRALYTDRHNHHQRLSAGAGPEPSRAY